MPAVNETLLPPPGTSGPGHTYGAHGLSPLTAAHQQKRDKKPKMTDLEVIAHLSELVMCMCVGHVISVDHVIT